MGTLLNDDYIQLNLNGGFNPNSRIDLKIGFGYSRMLHGDGPKIVSFGPSATFYVIKNSYENTLPFHAGLNLSYTYSSLSFSSGSG